LRRRVVAFLELVDGMLDERFERGNVGETGLADSELRGGCHGS
jgi:hypothetical protein